MLVEMRLSLDEVLILGLSGRCAVLRDASSVGHVGAVPRLATGASHRGPQAQIQDRTRGHAVSTPSLGSKLVPYTTQPGFYKSCGKPTAYAYHVLTLLVSSQVGTGSAGRWLSHSRNTLGHD